MHFLMMKDSDADEDVVEPAPVHEDVIVQDRTESIEVPSLQDMYGKSICYLFCSLRTCMCMQFL